MSTTSFEDFDESLLAEGFNVLQYTNDLINTTNVIQDNDQSIFANNINTLDLNTPLKKLNFDLNEINSSIDNLIKSRSIDLINEYMKKQQFNETVDQQLKPSLDYLNISYDRLNDDILKPYEKIQKLQNVLNKIHQTSNLLRDSLVFVHLINKLNRINLSINNCQELSIIHSQLSMILNENVNLITLKLIKNLNSSIVIPNKKNLLNFVSLSLTNESLKLDDTSINTSVDSPIAKLSNSLFILSPMDFTNTYSKIVQSIASTTTNQLSKTINSVKNLPNVYKDVVIKNALVINSLETLLKNIKLENNGNSNLLNEFISLQRKKGSYSYQSSNKLNKSLSELYWSSISNSYKKELEISINRGGPVGKSLINNKNLILNVINENMKEKFNIESTNVSFENYLDIMLSSISILSK
ncbi:hypothetical protein Kpol_1003p20 [Vanderwaltozyma polyspora DSM 70294]|uniref:Conserved oligomeric Golgi complex subunit 5 n=1 Tax=Vanderwaltozyma polyspora (strain ATCC 22028 / DSM 70294 / BCRC 21397 / CBS 2163 / NBRC 10782 / NRRL Y-8283 / UCD 57-17) TaxID=436907 RepID=A7TLX8_VANPO|nr:uncharacterized protein Kpol_1003p20 [Vanderwaltozyma polyspora DSM 70294]EDO16715.1 hypothetical protein Kpol_1003p20 [Vanderwaltozyma polyspora DSM 70294]